MLIAIAQLHIDGIDRPEIARRLHLSPDWLDLVMDADSFPCIVSRVRFQSFRPAPDEQHPTQ